MEMGEKEEVPSSGLHCVTTHVTIIVILSAYCPGEISVMNCVVF
jgi:hypothetical protein